MSTPNTNELVWMEDSADPTFVIIRNNDNAHYFYWPFEFLSVILKANDVEPIKVKEEDKTYVLSRFHFYGLTVWIDPQKHSQDNEDKPVAKFMRNFHTPIIVPNKNKTVDNKDIQNPNKIPLKDRPWYWAASGGFRLYLKFQRTNYRNVKNYYSKLVQEIGDPIAAKSHLFDDDYIRNFSNEMIIIGEQNEIDSLINRIKNLDSGNQLTPDAIISFFGF